MEADTYDLLRTSIRQVLTETSSASFSSRLDALGWDEVLADDAPGALRLLFDLKGKTLSNADALGAELARTVGGLTTDLLGAAVTLPGPDGDARFDSTTGALTVDVLLTAAPADRPIVVCVADAAPSLLAVLRTSDGLSVHDVAGEDPWLGLMRVRGTVGSDQFEFVDPSVARAGRDAIVATGQRAIAAELVGVGAHVVSIAVAYTKDRVQYGKPIGVFQALQHRMANAHALVVGAGDLVEEAFESGDPWAATVAKCLAGRAAEYATAQAQQCFGAIGFTWEHELHRYIKRAYVLDTLLGDWRTLEHEIGATLLETRTVPRLGLL